MLLAAILIERYIPTARQPSRETAGALLVWPRAYLTSAAFLAAPAAPVAHASHVFSRPWDLLPAACFLWLRSILGSACYPTRARRSEFV